MPQNDGYFTKEVLLSGEFDPSEVISPLFDWIDTADAGSYGRTMAPFSSAVRHVFAVETYLAEVMNGGHEQFFYNSSGIVWRDALDGLRAIGADDVALILRGALLRIGQELPDAVQLRRKLVDTLPDSVFEADDDALYAAETDWSALEAAYITAHAEEFVFSAASAYAVENEKHPQLSGGTHTAIFCSGHYYLPLNLPEDFDVAAAPRPISLQAIELREESTVNASSPYELGVCLAPYFISDYLDAPKTVVIEGAAYPVQVELLSQQAYNDRLRALVTAYCPGCRSYGGLTQSDATLSGHFSEISLNGFCPYRCETRSYPRIFHQDLAEFCSYFKRFGYAQQDAADMLDNLKSDLHLTYASGELDDGPLGRTLTLHVKKPSVLLTALTDILTDHVDTLHANYAIRLAERAAIDEAAVETLLSQKKIAASRKEFKKYGAAIGIIEFDPAGQAEIEQLIRKHIPVCTILLTAPGKLTCLLTDAPNALMRLRFAAPMLGRFCAIATVFDASGTMRYAISFSMPKTPLDAASAPDIKGPKLLQAEQGKVLTYDQVHDLFHFIELWLLDSHCDHTLRFTKAWLNANLPAERVDAALSEIQDMGGFCDCEVLANCYEEYDLDE